MTSPARNGEPLVELRGISKRFPGVQALAQVDFDLRRGEVHSLVGENGAGKSTLIKILTGVHRADGGSYAIDGRTGRGGRSAGGDRRRDQRRLPGTEAGAQPV